MDRATKEVGVFFFFNRSTQEEQLGICRECMGGVGPATESRFSYLIQPIGQTRCQKRVSDGRLLCPFNVF